jgi:hypothetical protein
VADGDSSAELRLHAARPQRRGETAGRHRCFLRSRANEIVASISSRCSMTIVDALAGKASEFHGATAIPAVFFAAERVLGERCSFLQQCSLSRSLLLPHSCHRGAA